MFIFIFHHLTLNLKSSNKNFFPSLLFFFLFSNFHSREKKIFKKKTQLATWNGTQNPQEKKDKFIFITASRYFCYLKFFFSNETKVILAVTVNDKECQFGR